MNPVVFLDDASRSSGILQLADAAVLARGLINTLRAMRACNRRVAVNASGPIGGFLVCQNHTLKSVLIGHAAREEWDFIRALNDRSPLSAGIEEGLTRAIREMDFRALPSGASTEAVAFALFLDSAVLSLHGAADWLKEWVNIEYDALVDDGTIAVTQCSVRNASSPEHVAIHSPWIAKLGWSNSDPANVVWSERAQRFPGLRFLPRVESDLRWLATSGIPYQQAIEGLRSLSSDVLNWAADSARPIWSRYASPEGEQRSLLCWVFDESVGKKELFNWHTRFTGGFPGRIHFRVDEAKREIVVGYVGAKLFDSIE